MAEHSRKEDVSIPDSLRMEKVTGSDIFKRFRIRNNELGPEKIVRIYDPETTRTWGYVAVDNLYRGASLGGIRIAPDITAQEVYHLAAAMTLKSAAAMLPLGGGKAGIISSPACFTGNPTEKRKLIQAFGKVLYQLPDYVPGPDMGTSEEDMQALYEVFTKLSGSKGHGRGGVGRPPEKGGLPIDEWGITAHGLFAAAHVAEECIEDFSIDGAKVIVQGVGNVGLHIARKLASEGAVIVGASDINRGLYKSDGLDLDKIADAVRKPEGLSLYDEKADHDIAHDSLDRLLELPCDILVPAARPDAITCENADSIQAKVILEGANNPVHGVIEYYLNQRKGTVSLTDWIVNAGGVIGCAVELKMDADPEYRQKVLDRGENGRVYLEELVYNTVSKNVREIFERARSDSSKSVREHAMDLARSRLADEKIRKTVWL